MITDLITLETKLVSGGDTPVICSVVEGIKVVLEVTGVAVCVNAHIGAQVRGMLEPITGWAQNHGCACGCACGCCSDKAREAIREITCTTSVAISTETFVALFRPGYC